MRPDRSGEYAARQGIQPGQHPKLLDRLFTIDQLPRVVSAKEEMENAALRLKRAKNLVADRALAAEEYTGREKDLKVAEANYEQARWDSWALVAGIKYRVVQARPMQARARGRESPTPTQPPAIPKDVRVRGRGAK